MQTIVAGSGAYQTRIAKRCVVTIGNFDGVHNGHKQLLDATKQLATQQHVLSCVYTFEPSPRSLLASHVSTPRIMSWQDKVETLLEYGIDCVVVEEFSLPFAGRPADWFAREILEKRLQAVSVVVGHDFRYGKARSGTVQSLQQTVPNVSVTQIPVFSQATLVVSSSKIRECIQNGDVELANVMLGRPFYIKGTVVGGQQRGREIGFPTANIHTNAELVPQCGVYAAEIRINGGSWLSSMVNIGMQPTFAGSHLQIEVHIFEFAEQIYGQEIVLRFYKRIRDEKKFLSVSQLQQQLKHDKESVLGFFVSIHT